MGNPYPVKIADDQGTTRLGGTLTFSDPANQPAGGIPEGGPLTQDLDCAHRSLVNTGEVLGDNGGLILAGQAAAANPQRAAIRVNLPEEEIRITAGRIAGVSGDVLIGGTVSTGGNPGTTVTITGANSGSGGGGASIAIEGGDGAGNNGRVAIITDNTPPDAGLVLVGTSDFHNVYGGVIVAAGVPVGAPSGSLPFAVDTTAVTGGLYVWNGAAWLKVAALP